MNEVQPQCNQNVRFLCKSVLGFEGPLVTDVLYPVRVLCQKARGILEFSNLQSDPGTSTQQTTALGNLIGEIDCYPRQPSGYYQISQSHKNIKWDFQDCNISFRFHFNGNQCSQSFQSMENILVLKLRYCFSLSLLFFFSLLRKLGRLTRQMSSMKSYYII